MLWGTQIFEKCIGSALVVYATSARWKRNACIHANKILGIINIHKCIVDAFWRNNKACCYGMFLLSWHFVCLPVCLLMREICYNNEHIKHTWYIIDTKEVEYPNLKVMWTLESLKESLISIKWSPVSQKVQPLKNVSQEHDRLLYHHCCPLKI